MSLELLNVKETAKYLNVSESFIRKLIRKKMIPYCKLSNKILINKESINNTILNTELEVQRVMIQKNN